MVPAFQSHHILVVTAYGIISLSTRLHGCAGAPPEPKVEKLQIVIYYVLTSGNPNHKQQYSEITVNIQQP